jgi:PhnB protein
MTFVVPMIAYEDGNVAMDWLIEAFGFVEADRRVSPEGVLTHGELEVGDGIIMLATPTPDYQGPKHHRENCEVARKWSSVPYIIDGVLVQVDDVKAHCERARGAGALILSEPQMAQDGRFFYRAEDVEGHRWMFEEIEEDS